MDPLSVSASVTGLTSLGIQVIQTLVDFYETSKNRDVELAGITGRLESLEQIFKHLQKDLSCRVFLADEHGLVSSIEESILSCDKLIEELKIECGKFKNEDSMSTVKATWRRVTYPFRQSTLQKLDEDISEIRENLSFALEVLHISSGQVFQDDLTDMKALLDLIKSNQISSDIYDWLNAPDATIEHNKACMKKHPGTGAWLIRSSEFSEWMRRDNSFMWLNGFAGTGKSIICSRAISSVLRHRAKDREIGVAFFYFTFDNDLKQDESSMIRALLLQLSSQHQDGPRDLEQLWKSQKNGVPPSELLLSYLRRLIQRFRQVFIFLDALDESPRQGSREFLLKALESMQSWGERGLHLLVTSRDEPDVRESIGTLADQQIVMQNASIEKDIADVITSRLNEDRSLRKLLPYHNKIRQRLARDAKGVFRWFECQLKSLQSCPRSGGHVEDRLGSLPQSLDETYERMLCNIEHNLVYDARRILTLLCFAPRPLSIPELLDGVAVKIKEPRGFDRKRRLQDAEDIRDICSGFIDLFLDPTEDGKQYARIAHFSVQEYLESKRIRERSAAVFSMNRSGVMAETSKISWCTCPIKILLVQ